MYYNHTVSLDNGSENMLFTISLSGPVTVQNTMLSTGVNNPVNRNFHHV
jgi:hypothetical protein